MRERAERQAGGQAEAAGGMLGIVGMAHIGRISPKLRPGGRDSQVGEGSGGSRKEAGGTGELTKELKALIEGSHAEILADVETLMQQQERDLRRKIRNVLATCVAIDLRQMDERLRASASALAPAPVPAE